MNFEKLNNILKTTGIPVAYSHFNERKEPPFITYYSDYTNNEFFDDKVGGVANHWRVELYERTKDLKLEQKLENALALFCWNKNELWIEDEKVFLTSYEFEEF